jgi:hypothetical protein
MLAITSAIPISDCTVGDKLGYPAGVAQTLPQSASRKLSSPAASRTGRERGGDSHATKDGPMIPVVAKIGFTVHQRTAKLFTRMRTFAFEGEMLCLNYRISNCGLALILALGLSVAWPSYAPAAAVYTFTFVGNPASNPGWDANGYFSIPVADFAGSPGSLPNSDITAASFTLTAPTGSSPPLGLSDIIGGGANLFTYAGSVPLVSGGFSNFLASLPQGCNPEAVNCTWGLQVFGTGGITIIGPPGLTQLGGSWTTSETPIPAALPLFAGGLGVMGLLARRRKRKTV